jgi:hypothetical protein
MVNNNPKRYQFPIDGFSANNTYRMLAFTPHPIGSLANAAYL